MTRTEIIALVNALTENKIGPGVDANSLFTIVAQRFCAEKRFWWRKISVSFNTVGGTQAYDLDTHVQGHVTASPVLDDLDIEEITKVFLVQGPTTVGELDPLLDDEAIADAIEDTTTDTPTVYFMGPSSPSKLSLYKTPSGVFKIRVSGWAMPNPSSESKSDTVPLIPARFHRGLVHGMEAHIWRTTYGMQDPKFIAAEEMYQQVVADARQHARFTTNVNEQFIVSNEAVRSTS